jgi:hypothetical protein
VGDAISLLSLSLGEGIFGVAGKSMVHIGVIYVGLLVAICWERRG